MAYDHDTDDAFAGVVTTDWPDRADLLPGGNFIEYVLSGIGMNVPQLSAHDIEKRLLWTSRHGSEAFEYYDLCPNFKKGGGGALDLSAWNGQQVAAARFDGDVSVILSSRADSRVEADLVPLSGAYSVNFGVYYV